MYNNIGQTPLARLRPERLDDAALKDQISIIQEVCGDIDPDIIAIVFHECDYNVQSTITRIKAGDFEDGGWQTAKSNNKKKNQNNHPTDQLSNGGAQSDSERSLSQRTSPTPSLRGGATGERQRNDYYQYSSRMNTNRRGNDSNRYSYNPRYPSRHYPNHQLKPSSTQSNSNELLSSSSKINEEITPTTSSSTDEYEFTAGTSQSLTFDNSLKKSSLSSFTKHPTPSTIPQEPVSMHPTIQFSNEPIDVQFGDVQWNDSIPIAIPPSNSPILTEGLDEQPIDVPDNSSTNLMDRELSETANRLSSSSFEIPTNLLTNQSTEETSHLSDRLKDSSQQQQISSASNSSPTSQSTNPFLLNSTNPSGTNPSAFTPYITPGGNFPSIPREYPQNWNQSQSTHYKPSTKLPMVQPTTYPTQTSYQIPPQPQFIMGTYPTPTLYPVITPVDSWYPAGYESYSAYPSTNYLSTYPNQQQYHSNPKHDQYYDKDFFANYGQNRLSNTELANSSQSTKDAPVSSKLSPTAASFPHGTSPAGTFYINPLLYALPTYYQSYPDRTMTYPALDNRNGASFGGGGGGSNTNRNHYHQQQQQRTHNNSTWHSQQ